MCRNLQAGFHGGPKGSLGLSRQTHTPSEPSDALPFVFSHTCSGLCQAGLGGQLPSLFPPPPHLIPCPLSPSLRGKAP